MTINKVCGSGLKAISLAAQAIALGDAHSIVAGGMESMSRAPYLIPETRWGARMGHAKLVDVMLSDGLWDCFVDCHMGNTAETLAARYRVSRAEQDRYALQSQERYQAALQEDRFGREIVAVPVARRKAPPVEFRTDESPRPDTSLEALAGLRPAFDPEGTVTAGNASKLSDGAAAVVMMSEQRAAASGLEPLAWVSGYATAGVDPAIMGIGPAFAIRKLLDDTGLTLADIDLLEVNEAFAGQVLAVGRELEWGRIAGQRQRRRHRRGPPPGRQRYPHCRDPAARDAAARGAARHRRPLHRRRHGHRAAAGAELRGPLSVPRHPRPGSPDHGRR